MRVIPLDNFVSASVPAWIVVTSVLNFRAYHLEDEGTQVLRAKTTRSESSDGTAARDEGFTTPHVL
jgi:hypothetical protein